MTGQEIRARRIELGYTQQTLSNQVGVSWVTVSRWENGKSTPSPLSMKQITQILATTNAPSLKN